MAQSVTRPREARPVDPLFRAEVLLGLGQAQKTIPARWLYDRRGSELFEDITRLEEYYPSRTETALLRHHGRDIALHCGPGRVVVEFGSGSSAKTPLLLEAVDPSAYVAIDICGEFLRHACDELAGTFDELEIWPVEANFMAPVALPPRLAGQRTLGFFPGSTIGNMLPADAVDLLRMMRHTLGERAQLLIGIDRTKAPSRLLPAYDDARGVTAAFNLNLLDRINDELGGDIPVARFRHEARWNADWQRIEMHLAATGPVSFSVAGRRFAMLAGETIHTENSHKYAPEQAGLLLRAGGWSPVQQWTDGNGDFLLLLTEATPSDLSP
ncbi:MAG TPA: L-histidine N(alpha)-methyltransferase [Sphingomonas sp.]|nr:L-histidine N(alpha)-methyltransferase [Sphingomonas sp.]